MYANIIACVIMRKRWFDTNVWKRIFLGSILNWTGLILMLHMEYKIIFSTTLFMHPFESMDFYSFGPRIGF